MGTFIHRRQLHDRACANSFCFTLVQLFSLYFFSLQVAPTNTLIGNFIIFIKKGVFCYKELEVRALSKHLRDLHPHYDYILR
jgi:hypothetical protein